MRMLGAGARSILTNATYLFGSHVATTLLRGVYVVVLARRLGPESFGAYNYGLAWYLGFIALTYLGLDNYLIQRVSADKTKAGGILYQTLVIRGAAAVIVAGAMFVIALYVEDDWNLRSLIGIFSIALVGRAIWLWAVSAFTAFESTHFALRCDAIFRPTETIAALAILALQPDLHWLAAMHAVLWCLQGGLGLHTVTRRLSRLQNHMSGSGSMELLGRTLPSGLYTIVITVFMQAPIVIMKWVDDDQFRFGQFVLAYQVCVYFLVVPYLLSTVMLPVVSRAALRGDGDDIGYIGLLVRLTCVAGAAAAVAFGPAIPALTAVLFGVDYREAGELLSMAMWLAIPFSAVTFLLQLFFARGAYLPIGIYGALGAAIMLIGMPPAASIASQAGVVLVIGAGLGVWLIATLVATDRYVPTYERWRSVGALASAVAAALAYTLTAGFAEWLQIAATLGVLTAATIASRAIDEADLRLLARVVTGALGLKRS